MNKTNTLLSICTRCRDGREHIYGTRGGARLAEKFMKYAGEHNGLALRGVHCMSQCKRPCVVSFAGTEHFTYSFGDEFNVKITEARSFSLSGKICD